jgi:hypothetical protein
MPIEFRCRQCGKLLRTGDETAGRQAQCPACGALSTIPGPGPVIPEPAEAGPPQVPPLAPLGLEVPISPDPAAGSPFGPGAESFGTAGPHPSYPGTASYTFAASPAERVSGPATALMVTAILAVILHLLVILANVISIAFHGSIATMQPFGPEHIIGPIGHICGGILASAMWTFVLIGAIRMKRLESYGFVMAAAIVAMIPCISPCCLLGLPFGIWALVVLTDGSVKAAFRS